MTSYQHRTSTESTGLDRSNGASGSSELSRPPVPVSRNLTTHPWEGNSNYPLVRQVHTFSIKTNTLHPHPHMQGKKIDALGGSSSHPPEGLLQHAAAERSQTGPEWRLPAVQAQHSQPCPSGAVAGWHSHSDPTASTSNFLEPSCKRHVLRPQSLVEAGRRLEVATALHAMKATNGDTPLGKRRTSERGSRVQSLFCL